MSLIDPTTELQCPTDWVQDCVKPLIAHYDSRTEVDQVPEDETDVAEQPSQTVITVPDALLPVIRQLLAAAENS